MITKKRDSSGGSRRSMVPIHRICLFLVCVEIAVAKSQIVDDCILADVMLLNRSLL